ncbi:hypothetical protein AB0O47_20090 [Streptomyces noursei]|uniref:hypothetical protein n=1 Tax=Streptomyces noursei TaxID=1971 RepID=UPI0034509039
MGDFADHASAFDRVIRHGADSWRQLEREEDAARRRRSLRGRADSIRRASRNDRARTQVKVLPEVLRAALKAADGDASRLKIVSATEVWVT